MWERSTFLGADCRAASLSRCRSMVHAASLAIAASPHRPSVEYKSCSAMTISAPPWSTGGVPQEPRLHTTARRNAGSTYSFETILSKPV